jgi:peptide/nickel transport system substrate-binding protein/oligopeptide transport system substrate-binding protein
MFSNRVRFVLSLLVILAIMPIFGSATAVRAAGSTLTWSLEGINDLNSLDPTKATDAPVNTVLGLIYGGLVRLDGDLHVAPDLAESWKISDDGKTYTFKLRANAKFSDGSPITADDVKWSFTRALAPDASGGGLFRLGNIAGAEDLNSGKAKELTGLKVVDAQTVEITVNQPSAYFLDQLTYVIAKILSKKAAEANPQWADKPVSSGAFTIQEWHHNQDIVLVPNTNYWQPPTNITTLTLPFIQDSETAFQLYRTGKLDIMGSQQNGVPAAHVKEVEKDPDFRQSASFAVRYVAFNNKLAPFDNVKVRRAFAMAVDKKTLAEQVLAGTVTPTDRILPAGFPGSELPIKGLSFDPAAAKASLADAGVKAGDLKVKLTYGVEGDNERVVTVLQSMWKENLGVDVTLEPLELSTFSARLDETFQKPESGLQAYYSIWGADYPDPQNFISQQLRTGVNNNNSHYSNPEFDKLVDQADVMTGDIKARLELYNKAEQIAVDEVGWLPLYTPKLNVLVKPYVKGIVFNGQGLIIPDYSALQGKPS